MNTKTKGFTLIELLVVIAIIGILSSVVLASLNTARNKGADAAVRANLNGIRAQAELVYDDVSPNSYATVCTNPSVTSAIAAAKSAAGDADATVTTFGTPQALNDSVCKANGSIGWLVSVPLKSTSGQHFCVDGTGRAGVHTTVVPASTTTCPAFI
jgi:prepilin-type N-terminal cleavage/methylation domain-containing protein